MEICSYWMPGDTGHMPAVRAARDPRLSSAAGRAI
jgi:hypothetical protein